MRLTVLYDPDGVILAAVEETGACDHPVPVAGNGNEVGSFAVPQTALRSSLETICLTHRVARGSAELRPAPGPQDKTTTGAG